MQIDENWLKQTSTQRVFRMLEDAGHQAYAVGGCVRNALLGVPVTDIDIATSATPEQTLALAQKTGLKAIPTGIDHGTITVISDTIPYEITTFRRDIETDGRHAVVAFTDSMTEDARRRDFTMNALYADASGRVHDPLSGIGDLQNHYVRFIEDANARIREDYLRSLRFFRFHAQYGNPAAGLDPDAIAAIAANLDGLETLAEERIGAEMRKLLAAPDPAPALAGMMATGALGRILSGADPRWIAPLVHLERAAKQVPDSVRRLVVLGGENVSENLRLTRIEERQRRLLSGFVSSTESLSEIAWRHGADTAWSVVLIRHALMESALPPDTEKTILEAVAATCPITARDLLEDRQGPALGAALRRAETAWVESKFQLEKERLIEIALKEG